MADPAILATQPLGFPWATVDPFLFCAYHDDAYPAGNEQLGPAASLAGRQLGMDFAGLGGWRMYHGEVVPGFPQHPHRGFETVTVVRRGLVDHSDSLGATARFGPGDVQWITAGRGVVHCEMFPLLDREGPNPLELFQIWLNLPRVSKMADPHFRMFWAPQVPEHVVMDDAGRRTVLRTVAGTWPGGASPPAPPPSSWAARADADVAIWTLALDPGARVQLPPARPGSGRALYYYRGSQLRCAASALRPGTVALVRAEQALELENGGETSYLLMLQGRPIGEPVAARGPFVMNTATEIEQAFLDYRRTGFGGWPWASDGPVHRREQGRFARHVGGREEVP
jgi:hypothetical protein